MKRKGKYITTTILLACLSKPPRVLAETIVQREKLIEQWAKIFITKSAGEQKDIHAQLEETIGELRKELLQYRKLISPEQNQNFVIHNKEAA